METSFGIAIDIPDYPIELTAYRNEFIDHPGKVIPPHISITGLFSGATEVDEEMAANLVRVCREFKSFEFELVCPMAFPKRPCLWLAPNPMAPFEALYDHFRSEYSLSSFWRYPTFHMTIGLFTTLVELDVANEAFLERFPDLLPWRIEAKELTLWKSCDETYARHSTYALGS